MRWERGISRRNQETTMCVVCTPVLCTITTHHRTVLPNNIGQHLALAARVAYSPPPLHRRTMRRYYARGRNPSLFLKQSIVTRSQRPFYSAGRKPLFRGKVKLWPLFSLFIPTCGLSELTPPPPRVSARNRRGKSRRPASPVVLRGPARSSLFSLCMPYGLAVPRLL